jgi:multiple sugar transport system permease protein
MTATLTRGKPSFKPAFKQRHSAEGGQGRYALMFLLPTVIGFAAFYIYPSIRGVWLSVTDWNLLSDPEFVGMDNYAELATDPLF